MKFRLISISFAMALVGAATVARAEATTDRADRATATLPSHARDAARLNAFGQQGERARALHMAARAAAMREAHAAAGAAAAAAGTANATVPTLPDRANARAATHGPTEIPTRGLETAISHGAAPPATPGSRP